MCLFFFNALAPTDVYTLSLHDALPILPSGATLRERIAPKVETRSLRLLILRTRPTPTLRLVGIQAPRLLMVRSEEHTSELQSLRHLVCRLLLEKKKKKKNTIN